MNLRERISKLKEYMQDDVLKRILVKVFNIMNIERKRKVDINFFEEDWELYNLLEDYGFVLFEIKGDKIYAKRKDNSYVIYDFF